MRAGFRVVCEDYTVQRIYPTREAAQAAADRITECRHEHRVVDAERS